MRPDEVVAAESPNRIRDHFNRTARFNPTKSLTSLTSQLTHEYEDRFLVELIQNAYDAHPPGSSGGRVHVRLEERPDETGALYVANTGKPFTEANFDALTNVAQSSKPPGEGVGNKGVGFRSVLQVCESPEIFSADPANAAGSLFNGFCFGFASDVQIREMVRDDADYETVIADFSRYLLPVVANPDDPQLARLRALGFVTVIRLPLTSPRAVALARAQVERLLEPNPPIALFLDRLTSIEVEHVGGPGGSRGTALVGRQVEDIGAPSGGPELRWVDTMGLRFLTTTRCLPAADVRSVVAEAVDLGELDSSWTGWDAEVEVSLALETGQGPSEWPALYTYLPMRVPAPLCAHLHAPFHTKLARLNLNEDSYFNSFLVRTAAELAAETIRLLTTTDDLAVDLVTRQAVVVDLLTWDPGHIDHLATALESIGLDLVDSPLVPARGPAGDGWVSLSDVRVWDATDLEVLTAEAIEGRAWLLAQSLGPDRTARLRKVSMERTGRTLRPSDNEVGDWVEHVASGLRSAGVSTWNRFLNEVASVFDGRRPTALQRRAILLDENRKVRRTGPWASGEATSSEPTVFFPPQRAAASPKPDGATEAELSTVPKNLQRAITFLHGDIKLRSRVGSTSQRTPVGELLRKADLVEPFELTAVLSHIERLLAGRVSETTHRQALSWVFAQERASRSTITDLARLRLRVPTRDGWIPSDEAVFSLAWDTPRSKTLASLLQEATSSSPTIRSLAERIILSPSEWPFKITDLPDFRDFLFRCGVRDGLFPIALRSRTAVIMNGINYSAAAVAPRFGLEDYEDWQRQIAEEWRGVTVGPYTPYTGDQELWVVPGQDAIGELGSSAKDHLASAILESIAAWTDATWTFGFRRRSPHHLNKQEPQKWPSPARAFVEKASWFPMADPGRRDDHYFVPLAAGWTFDESQGEAAPRFARLAPVDQRRRLSSSPEARHRLERAGLKTWNTPASAGMRLGEIAALVSAGDHHEGEVLSMRRAASRAWAELVRSAEPTLPSSLRLVVSRGPLLGVAEPSSDEPLDVFILDEPPGLVAMVLEAGGLPLLAAESGDGALVATLLDGSPGFRPRRTSTVEAKVILDGEELDPATKPGELLTDVLQPWVLRTLLAIMDLRAGRFSQITERVLHDAEARLRRVRWVQGAVIDLMVDNRKHSADGRLAECVHIDDAENPLLVLSPGRVEPPSWEALALVADDLAELMKQAPLASEIRAAALVLHQKVGDWREPTDGELADALRCSVDAVTAVMSNLRTTADHLRFLLSPFVAVYADVEAASRFEGESVASLDELHDLLAELVGRERADELWVGAGRAESVDEIRRDAGTDLGDLNEALAALGRPCLHFPELHRAAMDNYLNEHRLDLLDQLRRRFFSRFEARAGLADYVEARDFHDVRNDDAWLDDHETPPDGLLRDQLSRWMETKGEAPEANLALLVDVDDVRATNRAFLDRALPEVWRLVAAWSSKSKEAMPDAWSRVQQVKDTLDASGCLDFVPLSDDQLLGWLHALRLWPVGMALTLRADSLALTPADLAAADAPDPSSEEIRRRARTILTFGDREFDTASDELKQLIDAIEISTGDDFLSARSTPVKLDEIAAGRGGSRGAGGVQRSKPRSYGTRKPSEEQTAAIGLAGEALAYRWLQRAYKETTPDSWVSANRTFQLGGHAGDDGLGYDFRIARKNETLFFEVKATTTDDYEFDIGESELRAARAARKGWYRIIFISSILDPAERSLIVLPNPLEIGAANLFAQVNQGMRLRFNPAER